MAIKKIDNIEKWKEFYGDHVKGVLIDPVPREISRKNQYLVFILERHLFVIAGKNIRDIKNEILCMIKELFKNEIINYVITPKDIHEQYTQGIKSLIEKQINEEKPDLDHESFLTEIQEKYIKLVEEFFHIKRP